MTDLRTFPPLALLVRAFRLVAVLEALSWAGLLVGMWFKYLAVHREGRGETMVSIFGSVHGVLVIAFVALAFLLARRLGWSLKMLALAVVATIPPFATLVFDWWADRNGHYQ